jgi:hypothetical protein
MRFALLLCLATAACGAFSIRYFFSGFFFGGFN